MTLGTRRLAADAVRGFVVFTLTGVALLTVSAQFAPGYRAGGHEASLQPEPIPATPIWNPAAVLREPVEIDSHGGSVRGWILRPADAVSTPGVVLVSGAGAADRQTMLDEATALATGGVAAIVYDKRSVGYSFLSRDYGALAGDAIAAADVLRAAPTVDPARVGIAGWSEGGWVAPLAIERAPDRFSFMILASASIVTPLAQTAWTADRAIAWAPEWARRIPATALSAGRPFVDYLEFDVTTALRSVRVPVYAVWGADDPTVPVASAARQLIATLEAPPSVLVLDRVAHGLPTDNGWRAGVATWIGELPDAPPAEIRGVEPTSLLAISGLPEPAWFTSPATHLPVAVLMAVASVLVPRLHRRRSDHTEGAS